MELTYYLNYIATWFYHNVLDTSSTYSIVKVLIIVGLVSLLVYQQYILFVLLCIVVVSAEFLLNNDNETSGIKDLFAFNGAGSSTSSKYRREVDKDELTTGVSLTREGFSLGMPKIIKGDDTGVDYHRSNKFIEEDSREFKKELYTNMNQYVIDISKCLIRFDVPLLLNTKSDITRDISRQVSLSDKNANDQPVNDIAYVSIIQGNTNATKLENIQKLNGGAKGDNASDTTYAELMKRTNEIAIRQRAIDIYGKAFGFRKRIDEILARMREEAKNNASNLHTIRVNESIVNEMRRMLAYFALIQQCHSIIIFEQTVANIYAKLDVVPPLTTLVPINVTSEQLSSISGDNNLFRIPFYDDSYNTNDEKRYFYGITYYFDKDKSGTPY